ncbi:hypothetical protein AGLY_002939, partial [Aphis glycines]
VRNAFKVIVRRRRRRPLHSALVVNNYRSNDNKVQTENNIRRQEIGKPQNNNKNKSDSSFMTHESSSLIERPRLTKTSTTLRHKIKVIIRLVRITIWKCCQKDNGKHSKMDFGGKTNELSSNKNEEKHGRYDALKHHDAMGEVSQEFPDMKNKNNHVDSVDNHIKEVNPHSESLGAYQIDKYGNCVERDLKYHHSST